MPDSMLIPIANRLADRVTGMEDGLSREQMIERAEEAMERMIFEWHAGTVQKVLAFIAIWNDHELTRDGLGADVVAFTAVADDIKCTAEQLGYVDIAAAAGELSSALRASNMATGDGGDDVHAALVHIHRCLADPHRVLPSSGDLLAASPLPESVWPEPISRSATSQAVL